RVDVERDAGDTDAASADAANAVDRARALGYAPLVARALVARGRIALAVAARGRGQDDFVEATRTALEVGDEPLAIEAYARAAFAIGTGGDPAAAVDGLPLVEAITARLGERAAFPRALLHDNLATVDLARGDRPHARALLEEARRESAGFTGAAAIEMTAALENLLLAEDDDQARRRLGDELVAVRTRLLGPDHPFTLEAALMRGGLIADRERGRQALAGPCAALAELHPSHRADIRDCAFEVGWRAAVAGDRPTTAAMARRVLSAATPTDDDRRIAGARGYLALASGDAAGAITELAAIPRSPAGASWWRRMLDADLDLGLALAQLDRGDRAAAGATLERAEATVHAITDAAPIEAHHRLDAITALRAR
ncbi:MAG TPA: hypothetical protein VHE35_16945, partial [Kofleriaceae bacterium]|nr:hypothetical protein [Kofleriaceae bacterium]